MKDPYATDEESASVMSKLPQKRKDAINCVARMQDDLGLCEQGVSLEVYSKGTHEVAVSLAEQRNELFEALQKMLNDNSYYFPVGNPWGDAARSAIAKTQGT